MKKKKKKKKKKKTSRARTRARARARARATTTTTTTTTIIAGGIKRRLVFREMIKITVLKNNCNLRVLFPSGSLVSILKMKTKRNEL